ncbi:hypothetical protein HUJ04_007225 [Dendroctonus ponderosae]|nr:hypothetical protein HUJ04_007225 [Dendroctonus ponderosae]
MRDKVVSTPYVVLHEEKGQGLRKIPYAQVNPQLNTRQISLHLGVTKDTIHRTLGDNNFHPYHVSLHQVLSEMDYDARLNFCNWSRQMYTENNQFLSRIL